MSSFFTKVHRLLRRFLNVTNTFVNEKKGIGVSVNVLWLYQMNML